MPLQPDESFIPGFGITRKTTTCAECGVPVDDVDLHSDWHARQTERFRKIMEQAKRYVHPPTYG